MPGTRLTVDLLPGAQAVLAEHQREMPQMNELCGVFWLTLALRTVLGQQVSQDDVAVHAWSVLSHVQSADYFPPGEVGRHDYARELPRIDDSTLTGTTPWGVVQATATMSDGRLEAVPITGPWRGADVSALLTLLAEQEDPCVLAVNVATRHFWGARPSPVEALNAVVSAKDDGPDPDWDVGHFIGVLGTVSGPDGVLLLCADTYPSLGWRGLYLQPPDRIAAAMRRDGSPDSGGAMIITSPRCAPSIRAFAEDHGLTCAPWDNGVILLDPATIPGAN